VRGGKEIMPELPAAESEAPPANDINFEESGFGDNWERDE
jgi:hypothetical protein